MSFEFNKIIGAILGSLLFIMALGIISDGIFSHASVETPGYKLPSQEAATAAPKAAPTVPLPQLLAKASVQKGEADTKVCQACHNFEKGAGPKVGPPLYGVVGRPKGSIPGFAYSDGMKKKGGNWTLADINEFITSPKAYVSGTKMAFAGESDPMKRADIVDYLHTLSDHPEPLPAVASEAPAAAPAAPAAAPQPSPSTGDSAKPAQAPTPGDSPKAPAPKPAAPATPAPAPPSAPAAPAPAPAPKATAPAAPAPTPAPAAPAAK